MKPNLKKQPAEYSQKNLINFSRPNLWMNGMSKHKSSAGHFPAVQVAFCVMLIMALIVIVKINGGF
jgi:hypothetical protein